MKTQKEKFDSMQRMYDNASPPEDMLEAREEARINEIELIEVDISSDSNKLYDAVTAFLTHVFKEGWPTEDLEEAFNALLDGAVERRKEHQFAPFNQICDAAALWTATRIADEMFKDK